MPFRIRKRKVKRNPVIEKLSSQKVKRIARRVAHENDETHYIDQAQGTVSFDSNGVVSLQLSTITQGDSDSSRTGDKVRVKSINIKGNVLLADTTQYCRIILFQWLQQSASVTPIPSDILQNQGNPYSPMSAYTKDYAGYTWVPLADRQIQMDAGQGISKKFSIKVSGKKLRKGKATGTIQFSSATSNGIGHYYLMFMSDSGAVAHPTFSYYSRIRFTG